jgi:hypothetical protein
MWFADDRKPNRFFLRSPFRSWTFLINTGLAAVVSLAFAVTLWKYWDKLSQGSARSLVLSALFLQSIVYPFWRALQRHTRVSDLFAAGYLAVQAAGSPLDEVLEVTDDAINDSLRNSVLLFGLLLFAFILWKLR